MDTADAVRMEGADAGVSFRSVRPPDGSYTYTVLSNTSQGVDSIAEVLDDQISSSHSTG